MEEKIELIQHPAFKVIRKSEDYVVDGLGKVTVMTAIEPEKAKTAKEAEKLYQGYAILGAVVGGAVRHFPVEWLIEGVNSLEDAFDVFQVQAVQQLKKNIDEASKRAQEEQHRIVTAPASALIRP